jgi:predicted Fe-Mo cluster-binding NifX family protein
MKLCFPVETNDGIDSQVYGHFGSAPLFIVHDTESNETSAIDNRNLGHVHGQCSPVAALDGSDIDAIVVGGIGAGAIMKLNTMGIKVFQAYQGTVKSNLDLFKQKALSEISVDQACRQHGGCS